MKSRSAKRTFVVGAFVLSMCMGSYLAMAQAPAPAQGAPAAQAPRQPMSFFVTSVGMGDGANLGGLTGADRHCQQLSAAAGSMKTFHAYLSTQASGNQPAVNARDRIGRGPWYNARGDIVANGLSDLHGDTLAEARLGNRLTKHNNVTEKAGTIPGVDDPPPNKHDVLTGSQPDGRAFTDTADHTCNNWTSNSTGVAMLGHLDRNGTNFGSWNAAHPSSGCSQANLVSTGGAGLFYCFAIN